MVRAPGQPESVTFGEGKMKELVLRFVREDEGQDLIEYALLCTLIALVVYIAAQFLGSALNNWYTAVGANVNSQASTAS